MSHPLWRKPRDLITELTWNAPRFKFFQSVRLLALDARYYGVKRSGQLPARLRFRTVTSLAFPASEVHRYQPIDADVPEKEQERTHDEMTVAFMGLTGPSGVLPQPYTELLNERRQFYRDTGLHAFLDIFSHRAIALFYSAWRKYRYWLAVEDKEPEGFTRNLLDFVGVGLGGLRARLGSEETAGIEERLFAFYAGLLSQKPLSAQAMITVIEGFFDVPARLDQFVGQWIEVPPHEQSMLGHGGCELGLSAFAGDRMWDRQTKIHLRMGPMRRKVFDQLLPGNAGAQALRSLVHFMVGHGLTCDVTLALDHRDVPVPRLDDDAPPLLDGNIWLNTETPEGDPDDMCYRLLQ
ncbi:MAG: type VI secretion system baseplate subunit TssG [Azoarcus sp.]|nr:type VI secretion system baseplate subunit TssG [Azoarcus sp.]MDR1660927.1 type VI secretion system baseplate subunit TssG [Azoarcus sp.]